MATSKAKVLPQRITGCILEWKGKYGWIQPDQQITHPEAAKKGGKVYLSVQDVEEEIEGVGSHVSFFVYADGSGLGAMNCRPHDEASPIKPMRSSYTPSAAPHVAAAAATGQAGNQGTKRPAKQFKKEPRQRISDDPVTGKVKTFKGYFGFIIPDDEIDHPLYKGQVYVAADDCASKELMEPGAEVTFYLYSDSQGIGAECCAVGPEPLEAGSADDASAVSAPPPQKASRPSAAVGNKGASHGMPAGGKSQKRKRITELEVTGEIVEWKGTTGWIQPHDEIEHPMAARKQGKVAVALADIQGDQKEFEAGQLVQFHVCVTPGVGLAAEEVLPF